MQTSEIFNHHDSLEQFNFSREFDSRIHNLSLEWIPFDKLYVTQSQVDTFDPGHVREILAEYHPAIVRPSSVALVGERYILWEGQHSATVNWLKGMDAVPCIVYKSDDMSFKQVPSIEKFDRGQLADMIHDMSQALGLTYISEVVDYIKQPDNYQNR